MFKKGHPGRNKGVRKYTSNCLYCKKEVRSFYPRKYCDSACYFLSDAFKKLHLQNGKKTAEAIGGRMKVEYRISRGYKYLLRPKHPFSGVQGYVAEHRLVAEQKLGRYLKIEEVVHHINEDRGDNRPNNLIVLSKSDHHLLHRYYEKLKRRR